MEIKPIRTNTDYETALKEIEQLFDAKPGTPEGDRLEILSTLVANYEEQYFQIPFPDPIEAVLYHLESRGLSPRDLEPLLGGSALVAAIINRERPLTLEMIRKLSGGLGLPAEVLIQPYELRRAA